MERSTPTGSSCGPGSLEPSPCYGPGLVVLTLIMTITAGPALVLLLVRVVGVAVLFDVAVRPMEHTVLDRVSWAGAAVSDVAAAPAAAVAVGAGTPVLAFAGLVTAPAAAARVMAPGGVAATTAMTATAMAAGSVLLRPGHADHRSRPPDGDAGERHGRQTQHRQDQHPAQCR